MARPQKHTVEYFSHDADASNGRTLSILFNHFGHEGNSAWWLLLERLSSTENHVISIKALEDFEYLASKLHFTPEKLRLILNKMAELEAIDRELYQNGLIWSQNFVNRQEPVYKTRKQELPTKPTLPIQEIQLSGKETPLSVPVIPHTKETKLKDTKVCDPPCQGAATVSDKTEKSSLKEDVCESRNGAAPSAQSGKDVCVSPEQETRAQRKKSKLSPNPLIAQMQEHLGYPAIVDKDPVPNPAKEGSFIKKMQSRGFSDEEIMRVRRAKVKARNNVFVSMQWVNEDIGKKNDSEFIHTNKKGVSAGRVPTEAENEAYLREKGVIK